MTEQLIEITNILDNPYQPRTTDDAQHIESLARSIAADGLLQKPNARMVEGGWYQLAFGHSRRKAFEWLCANWQEQGLTDRYNGYTRMPVEDVELADEEMYRHAVAENVQRKDLNPIELAKAMERYGREFNKNSDEVGQLFGVTGSTARGLIRLLDLHPAAQEKVADGTITQGVARTLVSMQKIASEKTITETLTALEKGEDRWENKAVPEEIISGILCDLDDAELMWSDSNNDGKPRGGRDGWLLSMKNFPNGDLPALTPVDVAVALDIQDNQKALKLVKEYFEYIDCEGATFPDGPASEDKDYMDSCHKQEQKRLDQLAELDPSFAVRMEHLINPPSCSTCPFYTKIDGAHYCGIKTCFDRKKAAWSIHKTYMASKELGIPLYQASDGKHRLLESYNDNDKKLFTSRNVDLRLIPGDQIKGYGYQSFEGVPGFAKVIVTGKALEKQAEAKRDEKREEKQAAMRAQLKQELLEKKTNELLWESTLSLKVMFDAVSFDVLKRIYAFGYVSHYPPGQHADGNEDTKAEWLRRALCLRALDDAYGWQTREKHKNLAAVATWLTETAKGWGVKLPKSIMTMAEEADVEIASVSVETKKSRK